MIGHGTPHRAAPAQLSSHAPNQFLIAPTGSTHQRHHSESSRSRDEDDNLSLTSSEASESGKFSSFGSTSERQSQKGGASSKLPSSAGSQFRPPPFGSHDLPLRSRDPSFDESPPQQQPPPPDSTEDPPLGSGGRDLSQRENPLSGDYTHRVRYPNNSGILVPPLLDEEISLKESSTRQGSGNGGAPKFIRDQGIAGGVVGGALKSRDPQDQVRSKKKEPFYCDRSHFGPKIIPRYPEQQRSKGENLYIL